MKAYANGKKATEFNKGQISQIYRLAKETFDLGNGFKFDGYDYNEKFVIIINADNKYIIGKKFTNCISIGSGMVIEYNTLEEIIDAINNGADIRDWK